MNHFCPGLPIILVGSKIDLRDDPRTIETLRKYDQHPVTYEEVSVRLCLTENYNPMHLRVRGWKSLRGYKQSITSNALEELERVYVICFKSQHAKHFVLG